MTRLIGKMLIGFPIGLSILFGIKEYNLSFLPEMLIAMSVNFLVFIGVDLILHKTTKVKNNDTSN